jgi:hypothetical protein
VKTSHKELLHSYTAVYQPNICNVSSTVGKQGHT